MSLIQTGVIGIRGIGQLHGQTMEETGRMQVRAICDTNAALETMAKEKFPEATFYTSAREMYQKEALELVAVVTPHNLHAPIAIEALSAGVNVIVEKPMATKYTDAVAMIEAANANDKFLTVFHNRRLDGWYLAAKSAIDDGLLGNVFEINIAINQYCGPETWRGYKETCGGVAFDWGVHLIDYARGFAGSPVTGVSGYFYRSPKSNPAVNEDHGSLRIYFASGAIANVTVSAVAQQQPLRYRLIGDKGTLEDTWEWGDNGKLKVYTRLSGGERVEAEIGYRHTSWKQYYDNIAAHMLDGAPLLVTGESAAENINILCTAERSYAQGGAPLPLDTVAVV